MSVRLLFVLLLFQAFMVGPAGSAHGAGAYKKTAARAASPPAARAFLLAKDIHQWLDFQYQYDYSAIAGGAGNATSFHNTRLENSYHFDTLYAILRPKLLMGRFDVDIGFDGQWQKNDTRGSDIGTNPTLQYRLEGTFLKDEDYPVDFHSFYKKDLVDRVFASNYAVDSRGEGLGFSYKNPFLPTQLSYSQSTSETSGLTIDRTSNSNNIRLSTSNRYKNFSTTTFNIGRMQVETQSTLPGSQGSSSEAVSLGVGNSMNLATSNLSRYLDSQYSYTNSKSEFGDDGDRVEDWNASSSWSERLYWQLGRALYSGLDYRNSFFESQRNQQETQAANGWLRHRLFDNFTTNFRMGARETLFLQGTESGWSGNLGFDYTRRLPKGCNLSLGLDNSYAVTERNLENGIVEVVEQPFTFYADRFNYLEHYDIVIDTIVVRSKNKERIEPYVEGTDYTVVQIGRQIRIDIPSGSDIIGDDPDVIDLLIDYDYTTNPDIKYGSKARAINTSVGLFDNSYRLAGQVSQASEELLAGDDTDVPLADSMGYMLSLEKNITYFTFKGEYTARESTTDKYHSWEPSVAFNRYYNQYFLSARLRGRQTEYEEVSYRGVTSPAGSERSISAQARLRKRLLWLPGATWENRVDGRQMTGRGSESTEVNVNSALQVFMGKSRISLAGEVSWKDDNGHQSQDASVWLKFRRYF